MDSPAHRPARQSAPTRPEPAGTPDHAHHEHDKAPPAHRTGGAQQGDGLSLRLAHHSHSMVPGGLLVQSSTTRLTSGTELVIRLEMRARTS